MVLLFQKGEGFDMPGPIGIHSPPCPSSSWWYHRTVAQGVGEQVQLRQDDLPQVLRTSTAYHSNLINIWA